MNKLLVILGPTASGKSALGVKLAKKFNGEVISADSRQVYRGLDIGTGKITKKEMRGVPHHLLDVASPRRKFTASDFVKKARVAYCSVLQNNKIAVVVGGTGFYIDALVGRIALPDVPPNKSLRERLEKKSATQLFAMLKKKDLARAKTIEPSNKRRLIRALEVAHAIGRVPRLKPGPREFDVLWIGLAPSLPELEKRIAKRLDERMKRGMVAEARRLHAAGLSYRRMEELGLEYRALARHLQGRITKKEMVEELRRDIRRYAKKQLAYWKRNADIKWFDPRQQKKIEAVVRKWLSE
jgi:tRNA dimethylallyltransferase